MSKELVWNVYVHNINQDTIEVYNIFQHHGFCKCLYKAKVKYLKKTDFRFEDFMEEVKKELMYYFWSKCEWEVVIKAWVGGKAERQTDVYCQVMINWELFKEYLRKNYKHLKKVD